MIRHPPSEYLMHFSSLCERAESTDSFTDDQKRRMNIWKSQLLKEEPVAIFSHSQQFSKKDYW